VLDVEPHAPRVAGPRLDRPGQHHPRAAGLHQPEVDPRGEGRAVGAWDATLTALGLPLADPPATLGEARAHYVPPAAVREDGVTDYFATSLPDLLLFAREESEE